MKIRSNQNQRDRDQVALLSSEDAPILSDSMPGSGSSEQLNSGSNHSSGKKKKGWRSRLFGGGKSAKNNKISTTTSKPKDNREAPANNLVTTASRSSQDQNVTQQQYQQRRQQHQQHSLRKASSRESANSRSTSASARQSTIDRQEESYLPKTAGASSRQVGSNGAPTSIIRNNKKSSNMSNEGRPNSVEEDPALELLALGVAAPRSMAALPRSSEVGKILERPFGRASVRPENQTWVVSVAPAEWEAEESLWKYRVTIQKRTASDQEEILQDVTNGLTFRSLADFYWLEQALHLEFHGSLLIPSLSISLGVPDLENCQHEVEPHLLINWLSDVLNGIRGQGEWVLTVKDFPVDWVTSCESMEAFMYQADLGPADELLQAMSPTIAASIVDGENKCEDEDNSILKWVTGDICGITNAYDSQEPSTSPLRRRRINLPINRQRVSSKAIANARSLDVQDSFVETATFDSLDDEPAKHIDLLTAEHELIWSWRTRALQAMEKLRLLQEEEKQVGASWRRFAISLSTLFAYEKDVESARLGDIKSRKDVQMPYRKLQKSAVEEVLQILAKHKVERCTPGLDLFNGMLGGYVADLSAVQLAVKSFKDGVEEYSLHLQEIQDIQEATNGGQANSATFAGQIQASLDQVKKQLVSQSSEEDNFNEKTQEELLLQQEQMQLLTLKKRLQKHEEMLKEYLTRLCRTVPVRSARMAFNYIQVETRETAAMHGAAMNLKAKIAVASRDSLSKMIHRHHLEVKEDRTTELQLVQRMVNLGNIRKFSTTDGTASEEIERGVEINKDMENENGNLRDQALEMCRERVGRWDSKVAMAIMEAVGVDDANVRVEETTRDLRLVRKYAIGLRENLQRCTRALEELKATILNGDRGDIRDLRQDLMWEIQTLFSGTYQPTAEEKTSVDVQNLIENGLPMKDPLGWRRKEDGCGGVLRSYLETRDSGTEWLLRSLSELLKDYNQRIEGIESFVYMECVGIQLEKHFSQKRAAALASFEKKTDITSAINIATRKRMPVLVKELQVKLEAVGADVSHTTVKEAKEAHLESKALKQELHTLSMRRLARARETSTERVISLMTVWSKEEESSASTELRFLQDFIKTLESSIGPEELYAYLEAAPTVQGPFI